MLELTLQKGRKMEEKQNKKSANKLVPRLGRLRRGWGGCKREKRRH